MSAYVAYGYVERWPDGVWTWVLTCPFCGEAHRHGGGQEGGRIFGGTRVPHCLLVDCHDCGRRHVGGRKKNARKPKCDGSKSELRSPPNYALALEGRPVTEYYPISECRP